MGRVTERVLVAVMLLTALQSALGQTAATAENQETESSPLETDRQDQDPLVQQFTASVSQLQQQCQSHQQTLSEQMSEQMSELRKESLSRQDTLSKQMSEQMSELEKKSKSHQETLSKQMSEQMSELRKESLSRQDTLSKQMSEQISEQMSELRKESLSRQDTLSKQMSELEKKSLSYREDLAELTLRIDRLLQERSLNHQGDLAELTMRSDRLPRDLSSSAGVPETCERLSGLYRDWEDYRKGFGDLEGNFWLGLDKLHNLTTSQSYELRVDLEKWDGTKGHATYSGFYVDDASNKFALHFDNFTGGNAGDSLSYHNGMAFSTWDRDYDTSTESCAQFYHGAWWYHGCYESNLNGEYLVDSDAYVLGGINWGSFAKVHDRYTFSQRFSEMKIRPT